MRRVQYRLLGTATAAPNDFTEIGTSSEALGDLGHMDMLARFFTNKNHKFSSRGNRGGRFADFDQDRWRLKGHAEGPFWRWVASWARAVRRPSDIGFDDAHFRLPGLCVTQHVVKASRPCDDRLFDVAAKGLYEERVETRRTIEERCEKAAGLLSDAEYAVAWCNLNDESKMLKNLIDGAVELCGSDSDDAKEEKLTAFSRGDIRVLVTKPVIGAWGLNWQHAHRMTYFPSHSYEQWYQSVRRMWRFGQTKQVCVDVITSEGTKNILDNLQRKSELADEMFSRLVANMNNALRITEDAADKELELPSWLVA
jgi:hypothetical protein